MNSLAQNWPTIRKLAYAAAGVICGGLVLAGIVTDAQSVTYLAYIGSGLGALTAILAGVNVNKPAETPLVLAPPVDMEGIAREVAAHLNYGVTQGRAVIDTANASVADARRQVEQALGEYRR